MSCCIHCLNHPSIDSTSFEIGANLLMLLAYLKSFMDGTHVICIEHDLLILLLGNIYFS